MHAAGHKKPLILVDQKLKRSRFPAFQEFFLISSGVCKFLIVNISYFYNWNNAVQCILLINNVHDPGYLGGKVTAPLFGKLVH